MSAPCVQRTISHSINSQLTTSVLPIRHPFDDPVAMLFNYVWSRSSLMRRRDTMCTKLNVMLLARFRTKAIVKQASVLRWIWKPCCAFSPQCPGALAVS